ncbi:MAG: GGDEF domain-containing protein [Bilophila wadsworthia]
MPGSVATVPFSVSTSCVDCAILKGRDCLIERTANRLLSSSAIKRSGGSDEMVYLVSSTDITEHVLHARKLERMAYHDSPLDIPNRQAALRNLQHMLREGKRCAVVLFDISDFTLFNETFGTPGDLLLKDVSLSIARFVPEAASTIPRGRLPCPAFRR